MREKDKIDQLKVANRGFDIRIEKIAEENNKNGAIAGV